MTYYEEMAKQYNRQLKEVLETILAVLNKGQRQKLLRNETVKALLERYHIEVGEA